MLMSLYGSCPHCSSNYLVPGIRYSLGGQVLMPTWENFRCSECGKEFQSHEMRLKQQKEQRPRSVQPFLRHNYPIDNIDNVVLLESLWSLTRFVNEDNVPQEKAQELWDAYETEYAAERNRSVRHESPPGWHRTRQSSALETPVDEKGWRQRYRKLMNPPLF